MVSQCRTRCPSPHIGSSKPDLRRQRLLEFGQCVTDIYATRTCAACTDRRHRIDPAHRSGRDFYEPDRAPDATLAEFLQTAQAEGELRGADLICWRAISSHCCESI